jgi:putative redox protein
MNEATIRLKDAHGDESPFERLAAALAQCTALTLDAYARRKGLPLEDAAVRVSVGRGEDGRTLFERTLLLEEPLGPELESRLERVAETCSVHKALSAPIEIRTRVARAGTAALETKP